MKTDLHIHSQCSTGTQTPEAVIQEAVAKGIGSISISDDDTMAAYTGLAEIAERYGVALIKGVQVSAVFKGNLIIHAAGGYAIIPGGYLRNPDTVVADVDQLVAFGVDGLEGFSPNHSEEMAKTLRTYAKAHQLLLTGGGDGHGTWASQEKYSIGIQEVDDQALNLGAIRIFSHPINGVTLAKQTDSERKD